MEIQHRKAIGKIAIITLICITLLPTVASGLRLGSTYKNDYVKISPDDSAEFTVLIWTLDEQPFVVVFTEVEAPEDWTFFVNPKNLNLSKNPDPPFEYINLPNEGSVKVKAVKVFVKPPSNVENGVYSIKLKALASGLVPDEISIRQERSFLFRVEIENAIPREKSIGVFLKDLGEGFMQAITNIGKTLGLEKVNIAALLIIVLILVFSLIIYKHG